MLLALCRSKHPIQDSRLLKVVNFATSVVTGLRRYDHVSRARYDLGLLTPRDVRYPDSHRGSQGAY